MILDALAQRYQPPTPILESPTVIQLDIRRGAVEGSGRPRVVLVAG
jgi:hypothetical protein